MNTCLPLAVGPTSERIITSLLDNNSPSDADVDVDTADDPFDHDLQLGLYVLNELHFRGWAGVDDRLEWSPGVVFVRTRLADEFERRLRASLPPHDGASPLAEARQLLESTGGPSVSTFLRDSGTIDHVAESMILRSPYQSKEADPHAFAIPRFSGVVQRTLVDIQAGEYGIGHARSHAQLFADALVGLDLDPTPNAHIDRCTGASLATSNLVTLGSMNRRLRGLVLGQLSLFEMDSVIPNQRMVDCCDRLGLATSVRPFFHIHVLADAEHQEMVASTFLTDYPTRETDQVPNLLLGMRAQSLIDHTIADETVPAWEAGASALVRPERLALALTS